jgi:hypothetical protein
MGDETNREEEKMTRNLKVLGLALAAVFAMSGTAASAATPGEFTSDGKVTVTGAGVETFTLFPGQPITCTTSHHTVMPQNTTPWGFFSAGAGITTLTDQSHYVGCTAILTPVKVPSTVTTNSCDFVWHIGETIAATTEFAATLDIVCIGTDGIEIHLYEKEPHVTSICTYKIPQQTGLTGATVKNNAGKIEIKGNVAGIKASRSGILCGGTKETNEATQAVNITASGTNEAGAATSISISD